MHEIIVRLKGGLGNQIFQFARGYSLAIENHAELYLDLSYFHRDARHGGFMLRDWSLPASVHETSLGGIPSWLIRIDEKLNYFGSRWLDVGLISENGRRSSKRNRVIVDGYWQHVRFFENHERAIRAFLQPTVELSDDASALKERIDLGSSAVALHIRRGDYLSDPSARQVHGVLGVEYYERAVRYIHSHVEDPYFFVFSDDIEWAESNLRLADRMEFVRLTDSSPVVDMYLMSRCQHNVIANSTYSWWAGWLNASSQKTVVAPKNWFNDPVSNRNTSIVPPEWVRL
ncbi:alpha-1,2-fucosyltransferase [Halothiobacillus sp.]|uniref:alpha-1,2-fucosyltransferase n=1 Tax=Halothiobacillus sp. TaxID=1891311 RepID=UPI002AD45781|nr:alpha-1,2-fucosyltransferase [Halothiobacillus sp.]